MSGETDPSLFDENSEQNAEAYSELQEEASELERGERTIRHLRRLFPGMEVTYDPIADEIRID